MLQSASCFFILLLVQCWPSLLSSGESFNFPERGFIGAGDGVLSLVLRNVALTFELWEDAILELSAM